MCVTLRYFLRVVPTTCIMLTSQCGQMLGCATSHWTCRACVICCYTCSRIMRVMAGVAECFQSLVLILCGGTVQAQLMAPGLVAVVQPRYMWHVCVRFGMSLQVLPGVLTAPALVYNHVCCANVLQRAPCVSRSCTGPVSPVALIQPYLVAMVPVIVVSELPSQKPPLQRQCGAIAWQTDRPSSIENISDTPCVWQRRCQKQQARSRPQNACHAYQKPYGWLHTSKIWHMACYCTAGPRPLPGSTAPNNPSDHPSHTTPLKPHNTTSGQTARSCQRPKLTALGGHV